MKSKKNCTEAPHLWYQHSNTFPQSFDFIWWAAYSNLYVWKKSGIQVLLYIDNLLLTYPLQATKEAEEINTALTSTYKCTNDGTCQQFIWIEIYSIENRAIILAQRWFINSVLRCLHMVKANNATTKLYNKVTLDSVDASEREADPREYRLIVAFLMYITLTMRPDLILAVVADSHYNSKPRTSSLSAAPRVLRYFKAKREYDLIYTTHDHYITRCTAFECANYSADQQSQGDHKYIWKGVTSSQSRKQHIVALSILVAEYVACSEASREGKWLLQLCNDVKYNWNDKTDEHSKNKLLSIPYNVEGMRRHATSGAIMSRTK